MEFESKAGAVIDERYRLEKLLGEGGHGAVWLAEDIHLNRPVAIKLVRSGLDDDGLTVARLQREAKVLQRLGHPNIVQVFRIGSVEFETYFLAMEYVPGTDLHGLLEDGPLPIGEAAGIALQIADAMFEAEKRGVIHRDLKPQNILVMRTHTDTGARRLDVKVADFGLCTMDTSATLQFGTLTRTGMALGTPLYMSPEQCQGKDTDIRSDIYSFGCVLFEMLTGNRPYSGETPAEILMKHVRDPVPSLLQTRKSNPLTERLQAIVSKCMTKNAKERYQSFADVHAALRPIAEANSKTTLEARRPQTAAQKRLRKRMILVAVALLAVGGLSAAVILLSSEEQKAAALIAIASTSSQPERANHLAGGIQLVERVGGRPLARKVAEATVLSEAVRGWPKVQRMNLLKWYVSYFRQEDDPQSASVFANALLDECLKDIADRIVQRDHSEKVGADFIAGNLQFLLDLKWPTDTWRAFSRTLGSYSGILKTREVASMKDGSISMLLLQFTAETALNTSPTPDPESSRRAADLLYDAAGIACLAGAFDRAREYISRIERMHHTHAPEAWLNLVNFEIHALKWADARRDFANVERLHAERPFTRAETEAAYQKTRAALAAGPAPFRF